MCSTRARDPIAGHRGYAGTTPESAGAARDMGAGRRRVAGSSHGEHSVSRLRSVLLWRARALRAGERFRLCSARRARCASHRVSRQSLLHAHARRALRSSRDPRQRRVLLQCLRTTPGGVSRAATRLERVRSRVSAQKSHQSRSSSHVARAAPRRQRRAYMATAISTEGPNMKSSVSSALTAPKTPLSFRYSARIPRLIPKL